MVELGLKPQLQGVLMQPQCQRDQASGRIGVNGRERNTVLAVRLVWRPPLQLALAKVRHATQRINLKGALVRIGH